jgi:hypothetical protein
LADGIRLRPYPLSAPGATSSWHPLNDGSDVVIAGFDVQDFLKLIHAHSVESRLGQTEFTLRESDLEKWRTYANGIRTQPKHN